MPSFRRSQRSVAAGLAASGFLVAAVIGAFLVVGGLVTYGVWPDEPGDADPAPALILAPAPAIVLPAPSRSPAAPAGPEPAGTPAAGGGAVARVVRPPAVPTSVLRPDRPALGLSRRPSDSGGAGRPPADDGAGADAAPAPGAGGLEPVVSAAESLTAGTARRLRAASTAVETMTAPLSPDVARIAGDATDCLADVVEGLGAGLAQGLRGIRNLRPPPAPSFPGARPSAEDPLCRLAPRVTGAGDGSPEEPAPPAG